MPPIGEERQRLTGGNRPPEVIVHQPSIRRDDKDKEGSIDIEVDENQEDHLNVPDHPRGLRKSMSMTSIREKIRKHRERFKRNECCGIILLLIAGSLCNVLSYLASVWSAQLNAEIVESAVKNEHTLRFRLKKTLIEGPSKYLIGLLNFGGRLLSAIGTLMLVQVLVAYCKRRRYGILLKSAAGETDEVLGELHGGLTETAGECCLSCVQALT